MALDGENPCGNLMLAASLLCKAEANPEKDDFDRAMSLLNKVGKSRTRNLTLQVCVKDAPDLRQHPEKGCGYTTAKQQVQDDEALEREKENVRRAKEAKSAAH